MGAIAVVVAAIGLALLLALAAPVTVLCHKALRDGGEVEAEIRALSFAFKLRVARKEDLHI